MQDSEKANVLRRPVGRRKQAAAAHASLDPVAWVDEHGDSLFRYA
jgi:hypothetical protein